MAVGLASTGLAAAGSPTEPTRLGRDPTASYRHELSRTQQALNDMSVSGVPLVAAPQPPIEATAAAVEGARDPGPVAGVSPKRAIDPSRLARMSPPELKGAPPIEARPVEVGSSSLLLGVVLVLAGGTLLVALWLLTVGTWRRKAHHSRQAGGAQQ